MLPEPSEPETAEGRASLTRLLQQVRATWIEEVLEEVVPAGIPLDLREAPSLEAAPTDGRVDGILSIYDRADRSVLILGDRGSGKTTALLELARGLVERAEADPREPVPVVLHLSSWDVDRLLLAEWMARQMAEFYRVPKRMARNWIKQRRIVPLLDGLDEVAPERQASCIEAINHFVDAGAPGLAVSCNEAAYDAIGVPLRLNTGFRLQPLTLGQVMAFIEEQGDDLAALADALTTDLSLQELAQTPLLLRVMIVAYRGLSQDDLMREGLTSLEGRLAHVFETYVERSMAESVQDAPPDGTPFSEDEIIDGTAWLARRMREEGQAVFLVERLQPSWLERRRLRMAYIAASRLTGGLVLGLALGIIIEIGIAVIGGGLLPSLRDGLMKLAFGVVMGITGGTTAAAIDVLRLERRRSRKRLLRTMLMLPYVALFGLIGGGVIYVIAGGTDVLYGIAFGLLWGAVFWLFFGTPRGRTGLHNDIAIVEALRFSRHVGWRFGRRGLAVGAALGLSIELIAGLNEPLDPVVRFLTAALVAVLGGAAGAVLGFVFGGLERAYIDTRRRPNEGIRLSMRNMVLGGATVAAAAALLLVPLTALLLGSWWGAAAGLTGALFAGLLAALWYGGMDVLQHYIVRGMLRTWGQAPHPLIPFLELGVRLSFLQRVGGGYLFVNDFIQSRFAAIDAPVEDDEGHRLVDAFSV